MTTKTYADLTADTTFAATDLMASWRPSGPGPLKTITGTVLLDFLNTYYLQLDGSPPMTAALQAYAGLEATPGIVFATDLDTGFWHPAANVVAVSANGTEVARWSASGEAVRGAVTATGNVSVGGALDVTGNMTSPTITGISSSLSSLSATAGGGGTSTSLSQISSSLSNTNTSLGNVSSSLSQVSSSLSSTNSNVTKISTSLANVSTSLALVKFPIGGTSQAAPYTTVLSDANQTVLCTGAITIDDTLAYPTGTFMEFTGGGMTLAINNSANLFWNGGTGTRTVANHGVIGVRKYGPSAWYVIYGFGIT